MGLHFGFILMKLEIVTKPTHKLIAISLMKLLYSMAFHKALNHDAVQYKHNVFYQKFQHYFVLLGKNGQSWDIVLQNQNVQNMEENNTEDLHIISKISVDVDMDIEVSV